MRLKHLGFKLSDPDINALFIRFKEVGDKKKFVYDDDLASLVDGQIAKVPETWSLHQLSVTAGNQTVPTATVGLSKTGKDATILREAAIGDGPVDAAVKAIDRITGVRGELKDYSLRAVSEGEDALGEVTLKADFGDGELITGKGASTDIIEASARAYLNALNRHLSRKEPKQHSANRP